MIPAMLSKSLIPTKWNSFLVPSKVKYFHRSSKVKWFKKDEGIRKVDKSYTIASREGRSSMIQQLPQVLRAKAYCAMDLEYILKKINKNTIL